MEKKKITIEVDVLAAVSTIGLLRGIFPSIIEQLEAQGVAKGMPFKFMKIEEMQEVLDEIYEKCIVHTDVRARAQAFMRGEEDLPN